MPEILEKINELRELFQERFGVEVKLEIKLHGSTPELANYISLELAAQVEPEEIWMYYNSQDDPRFVALGTDTGFGFVGHY
ncbi:MAG: hypothetical protein MJA84_04615 [Firmicutes bacterium]|nr:hypothetical protein [Bacillota bacterium]